MREGGACSPLTALRAISFNSSGDQKTGYTAISVKYCAAYSAFPKVIVNNTDFEKFLKKPVDLNRLRLAGKRPLFRRASSQIASISAVSYISRTG